MLAAIRMGPALGLGPVVDAGPWKGSNIGRNDGQRERPTAGTLL